MIKLANEFRKFSVELDSNNLIKNAGLFSKLENFLKKLLYSPGGEQVKELWKDIDFIQEYLNQLNKKINEIKDSVRNGDLTLYHQVLREIKELSLKLYQKLRELQQEGKDVEKIIQHYTLQEMKESGFISKIKQHMPEEFDLEFNKIYHKPLNNFLWFKDLSSESIFIRSGEGAAETQLINRIKSLLKKHNLLSETDIFENDVDLNILLQNFKQAIVDGELISVEPKAPTKQISNIPVGQIVVHILTSPFEIPNKNVYLQAKVGLIDSRTSLSSPKKLSLQYTTNLSIVSKQANILHILYKIAQNSSIKYTKLNDLQLAQILRQGYQQAFGQDPSLELLAGGWSQAAFESGRPVILPENNVGNIKATADWIKSGKPYFTKKTIEYSEKGEKRIDPNAAWRAYSTPIDGAADYWKLLNKNFKIGLDWMASGDPKSAAVAMSINPVKIKNKEGQDQYVSKSYFTANIPVYAKGMSGLYSEFLTKIAPQLSGLKSNPIPPPSKIPVMKNWASEYSQDELKEIKSTEENLLQSKPNNESNEMLQHLFANSLPLTKIVLQTISPIKNNKIVISFLNEHENNMKFVKIASQIFEDMWQSNSSINQIDNKIYLNLEIMDKPYNAIKASELICQAICQSFINKNYISPQPIISLGFQINGNN